MTEYLSLSESELQNMIQSAEKALHEKRASKKKEVINQIKELAASISVKVEIMDGAEPVTVSSRKGIKVAAKYRNPDDPSQTWTGRGVAPKWMQTLINSGREKSEFLI